EAGWGVDKVEVYRTFAQRVAGVRTDLRRLLGDLKQKGKRLAAYGAAAKGSTLLNYARIGTETLDFVVDRSTYKQGRYMPGVHLPILPPARLPEAMPDYVRLLTWTFADEVMSQHARRADGDLPRTGSLLAGADPAQGLERLQGHRGPDGDRGELLHPSARSIEDPTARSVRHAHSVRLGCEASLTRNASWSRARAAGSARTWCAGSSSSPRATARRLLSSRWCAPAPISRACTTSRPRSRWCSATSA